MSTVSILEVAAWPALRAPSVLNTQPWRWRVTPDALELRMELGRSLTTTDPDHPLQLLSCGAAPPVGGRGPPAAPSPRPPGARRPLGAGGSAAAGGGAGPARPDHHDRH